MKKTGVICYILNIRGSLNEFYKCKELNSNFDVAISFM